MDTGFGCDGVAVLDQHGAPFTSAVGLIVQTDGKIVACAVGLASECSQEPAALYRLSRDGALDTTFGQGEPT